MTVAYSDSPHSCMWFMGEPSQFSVGQTAQSLICSIMEKPLTGLDDCLNMLLACFRKRMSAPRPSLSARFVRFQFGRRILRDRELQSNLAHTCAAPLANLIWHFEAKRSLRRMKLLCRQVAWLKPRLTQPWTTFDWPAE